MEQQQQEQNKESDMLNEKENKKKKFVFKRGFIWRPVPTIVSTTLCFLISGVIFIVIGVIILHFSSQIKEIEIRYDNIEECELALESKDNKKCIVQIELKEKFKQPVMVYYQLNNFYQNHRRYIKSKSIDQLKGKYLSVNDIEEDCEPIIKNSDLWITTSIEGKPLDPDGPAHPCGLIARSLFNDSYTLSTIPQIGTEIQILDKDIAWESDRKRFKNTNNASVVQWTNIEDERFMVWMRPAGLPDFRKLWGRIEVDLEPGTYYLQIINNYQVKSFNGKKSFVLSTVNGLGGDNTFLGVTYIVVGAISLVMAVLFFVGYKKFNNDRKIKTN